MARDARIYKKRNLVGRTINKLKHFRRIATRYDRKPANFMAFPCLATLPVWLPMNVDSAQSNAIHRRHEQLGNPGLFCCLAFAPLYPAAHSGPGGAWWPIKALMQASDAVRTTRLFLIP